MPGPANQVRGFTAEEVERARTYHRPLYRATAFDLTLELAVFGALSFRPIGGALLSSVTRLPLWAGVPAATGIVLGVSFIVQAPLSYWRGYLWEKKWGFSTQSREAWAVDRLKALAVSMVLVTAVMLGLFELIRSFPTWWLVPAAVGASLMVLFLSFIAPVVLEPIFNRFSALEDQGLSAELKALAVRAGVPVREVLVADASRRSTKDNAYVSGLGATRRVVIFDTLLRHASRRELDVVVAHELGHRRLGHVAKGTVLGIAGAVAGVFVLWILLRPSVMSSLGFLGPGSVRLIPFVLLVVTTLGVAGLPVGSAFSRRLESEADRFSLDLTEDPRAFEETFSRLATSNLMDLDPPRLAYLFLFSHPTPPERIVSARRWQAKSSPGDQL
jgi:Zn-dependent protease with chaperone function